MTQMPSLESNRPQYVRVPGRVGAPDPQIGNLLQVASDVDNEGYSVDPEHGPRGTGFRVTITILLAGVVFGFAFFIGMLATNGNNTVGLVVGAIGGAIAGWLGWNGMGKTKKTGSCVYVGSEGVTAVEVDGSTLTPRTATYDLTTVSAAAEAHMDGQGYLYTIESVRFIDAKGEQVAAVVGVYNDPARPNPLALAVRATIAASVMKRLPAAQAKLAAGEQLVFPIFKDIPRRPTGEQLALDNQTVSYQKSPGAAPLRVDRTAATVALRKGYVDLSASGVLLGTFERETVANYDLLATLLARSS